MIGEPRIEFVEQMRVHREGKPFTAQLACCGMPDDRGEAVTVLHPIELSYYNSLKYEKRINDYILGRTTAKRAISALTGETKLDAILIRSGVFNQPVVCCERGGNVQVSITHCDNISLAVAFVEDCPMGIDLEKISRRNARIMKGQFTLSESRMVQRMSPNDDDLIIVFWTAKEALSKVLKTGLTTPLNIFEIDKLVLSGGHSLLTFKHFPQYQVLSVRLGEYVFSIVYPRDMDVDLDWSRLKDHFKRRECSLVENVGDA